MLVDVHKDLLRDDETITNSLSDGKVVTYRLIKWNNAAEPVLESDQVVDPLISIMGPVDC